MNLLRTGANFDMVFEPTVICPTTFPECTFSRSCSENPNLFSMDELMAAVLFHVLFTIEMRDPWLSFD